MTTLRQALYGIALLGALGLMLWGQYQRSQAEQGRTALAQEKLENLTARSNRQAATIIRLGGAGCPVGLGDVLVVEELAVGGWISRAQGAARYGRTASHDMRLLR